MCQYQSVPFDKYNINCFSPLFFFPKKLYSNTRVWWEKNACFSLHACFCGSSILFEKVSLNSKKRHADGETGTLQTCSGNQLFCLYSSFLCWLACSSQWCNSTRALVVLLMLLCSSLGSDGPLGSSCFCARLRQKPCVSSSSKQQRKPSRSCGGSGINSGIAEELCWHGGLLNSCRNVPSLFFTCVSFSSHSLILFTSIQFSY